MLTKISLLFLICISTNAENHEVTRELNHNVSRNAKREANSTTTPVEVTINQGESDGFHFDWISLLVEGLAMLTGFIALWLKMRKERQVQKDKRSKLKGKLSQIYTDVVPSFNSLSESVYKLDATINNNSAHISRNFSRENSAHINRTFSRENSLNQIIKEVKTTNDHVEIELEDKKIVTDLYIYEDIIDVTFRYSDQFVVSCFNDLAINKSLVEIERIESIINLAEDFREKLLPHKVYNGIRTVLNYTPIESFQISKNHLDEFFV